ncbi:plasminogen-binding N-terminal domain-containing protein [Campylobacter sp. MIT 21-1685]|uniref:plasminogen-binding N-terminal domain-containing protein n=1 Tax=unclassified Campylobacter TaxID=2593542 RepID=UPI00224B8653|nr:MULTISPECIES: plasminogen-binding N-terminal domain-containing protein [unclassified Campylobacter]MCX2682539.1 plasminogen-binding N-terminal domain-containing protein [Campylobacter sp. MIT 21-1684]MCX2750748.1 plasminogen-binding N-terminal domain-containing protein [Campylobacter sp. MIT 21-1682]MCX2807020.1 plasminogen-binding N-terminal domain-containing protein [Campylobacter sp. MIT 21-1685]
MLKSVVLFFAFTLNVFADFNSQVYKTQLLEVDDIYAYIQDSPQIRLYSSGVVVQSFENSKSIVARVRVIAKEDNRAKLELSVFSDLEQKALPVPNILPKQGDEVVLNFLYDRALVIAPNEQSYHYITSAFKQIYFTHVDIFNAQLIRTSVSAPKRSDFRKFCADNALGIVVFALDTKAFFVDCQNFDVLDEVSIPLSTGAVLPFYSRIDGYKKFFLDFNSNEVTDYYKYYTTLIARNRLQQ